MELRSQLVARGKRLEYLTLGWNSLEALVAIAAGWLAGSVVLVGFGLDSVIECLSGAALLWRLHAGDDDERRERVALRVVGISFLVLACYVAGDAAHSLWTCDHPAHSLPGIVLACASLIVMPLLARAKRHVAAGLSSNALHADSRQTEICAYLSAILVGGLALNALLNWWWADPVAALLMSPIIAREGVEALRGNHCACATAVPADAAAVTCGCTQEGTDRTCRGC